MVFVAMCKNFVHWLRGGRSGFMEWLTQNHPGDHMCVLYRAQSEFVLLLRKVELNICLVLLLYFVLVLPICCFGTLAKSSQEILKYHKWTCPVTWHYIEDHLLPGKPTFSLRSSAETSLCVLSLPVAWSVEKVRQGLFSSGALAMQHPAQLLRLLDKTV